MIIISLHNEHNITIREMNLRCCMKQMGLNRVVDTIDSNWCSYEEINHIIEAICDKNNKQADLCKFKEILPREHNIHIHRYVIC